MQAELLYGPLIRRPLNRRMRRMVMVRRPSDKKDRLWRYRLRHGLPVSKRQLLY